MYEPDEDSDNKIRDMEMTLFPLICHSEAFPRNLVANQPTLAENNETLRFTQGDILGIGYRCRNRMKTQITRSEPWK